MSLTAEQAAAQPYAGGSFGWLTDAWDSATGWLTDDAPSRPGLYSEAGEFGGIPGYGDRSNRLLEGRRDYSSFRGQQQEQLNRLLEMSKQGDPLARARLNQQAEAGASRAQAQALSMGPGNAALGARMAMQQGSLGRRDAAGKGAMADVAARLGATQQMTGALQGMRGQDQKLMLGMSRLELQQAMSQGRLGMSYEDMLARRYGSSIGQPTQGESNRAMVGQAIGFGGMIASDRKLKKNVRAGAEAADEFMSSMKPRTFRYKDRKFGEGEHLGVMAQDMERSTIGRGVVTKTPHGKMLNMRKLQSGLVASVVRLNDRLRELEKGK